MKNDSNSSSEKSTDKTDKFKKNLRFDSRLLEWNLKHKVLVEKDIKDHASGIVDCSENADSFAIDDIA